MKVLLAGANSYIGTHLIPLLLDKGHHVVCLVRDKGHFIKNHPYAYGVTVIGGDLLRRQSIDPLPVDIDAACYLVNIFTQTSEFAALGALSAQNFMEVIAQTNCMQVITLGDLNDKISHTARLSIEDILSSRKHALTVLNMATIIGEGSTALEMFKTLVSKNPIVIPQTWIKTCLQPISCIDALQCIEACLLNKNTFGKKFDLGGPDILTFKQMVLTYIAIFKTAKPSIVILPFLTSQLSSNLLNTLTPVSYAEAKSLIENLKHDTICRENNIKVILPQQYLTFKQSVKLVYETVSNRNFLNMPLIKSN